MSNCPQILKKNSGKITKNLIFGHLKGQYQKYKVMVKLIHSYIGYLSFHFKVLLTDNVSIYFL